ncbi:hypothetical protein HMPREF1139_1566 [Campylobacter sp. FOBRC14]|nr:hypothetical protein HMPREF1139_1566 [Campylobacter sp. FOBRC14]
MDEFKAHTQERRAAINLSYAASQRSANLMAKFGRVRLRFKAKFTHILSLALDR